MVLSFLTNRSSTHLWSHLGRFRNEDGQPFPLVVGVDNHAINSGDRRYVHTVTSPDPNRYQCIWRIPSSSVSDLEYLFPPVQNLQKINNNNFAYVVYFSMDPCTQHRYQRKFPKPRQAPCPPATSKVFRRNREKKSSKHRPFKLCKGRTWESLYLKYTINSIQAKRRGFAVQP